MYRDHKFQIGGSSHVQSSLEVMHCPNAFLQQIYVNKHISNMQFFLRNTTVIPTRLVFKFKDTIVSP